MKKIKGLYKLLRFELPFSAGVCVVMGQMLALGKFADLYVTLSAFLSIFFVSSSILVLNDYFDVETDRINAPHRPIPSNEVKEKDALIFSVLLFIGGFLFAYIISIPAFLCALLLSVIGVLYNAKFKMSGLLGNLMVSFSVGMTFVFGGITVNQPFNKGVLFFAVIAALVDLGEEIAADAMDIEGDKLINSKSLAIKYGRPLAIKISTLIFVIVVFISMLPFILNWFDEFYLFPIALMDISIIHSVLKLLKSENEEGRRYIRRIYLGSTFGLVVFILMRFLNI